MEPIKITDKLTLRQEALRMAVELSKSHAKSVADTVYNAKLFAEYIQGDAELPERDNAMEKYLLELKDSVLNFKSNPWISADDEMKPAKGIEVVCALRYGSKIEYVVMSYNHEEKEWCGGNDDDNTNHVVAWMPLPPFLNPTL